MNQKIRDHVAAYNVRMSFPVTDWSVIETIREAKRVWRGNESPRRWWIDCLTVVEVDGMLIGFGDAITTGDDSPRDKGWEFDPSTICEVVAKQVTTTVYEVVPSSES